MKSLCGDEFVQIERGIMPKCSIRSVWSQSRKRLPTAMMVELSAL